MSKYDWSNVPTEVNWIATDANGRKYGYIDDPEIMEFANCWHSFETSFPLGYMGFDTNGCAVWQDSLEERPK